jgi:hypothetical protein
MEAAFHVQLGESWFAQGMRITQFVEHILVGRGYFGYHNFGFNKTAYDVIEDNSRPENLAGVMSSQAKFGCQRLNDISVEYFVRFRELHYDEHRAALCQNH